VHRGKSEIKRGIIVPKWRWHFIIAIFCFGLGMLAVKTARAQMPFGQSLDDSTMEEYSGSQLAGRIHITHTYVDHQRFGFFKLGIAPVPVAEGVTIQIRSACSLTNVLEAMASWNISTAKLKHLEFRNLEISLLSEQQPRLRADKARLVQPDVLELSHVSVSNSSQTAVAIRKATLQVSGPDCGRLSWDDSGTREQLLVFQPTSTKL
jgi:hypothetical protein